MTSLSRTSRSPLIYFLLITGLITAAIFGSRAFTLGFTVSICYIFLAFRNFKVSKIVWTSLFFGIIIVLFVLIFQFKSGSSMGRLLIYKVSWDIFKDHWFWGVGFGKFKSFYNLYQAKYFQQANYSKEELLLADNTYFAFNDYWQFIIENGILGILLLTIVIFVLCKLLLSINYVYENIWRVLSVIIIVTLGTAALFTHVFEKFYFQLILLTAVFGVLDVRSQIRTKNLSRFIFVLLCLTIIMLNYGKYLIHYQAYQRLFYGIELSRVGYKARAMRIYEEIYPELMQDEAYVEVYANACFSNRDFSKALALYRQLLQSKCSNLIHLNLAVCYQNIDKFSMAEKHYREAVNMVPNRFVTRRALFKYYLFRNEKEKARQTAIGIINLPVKIPSLEIDIIKREISLWLKKNYLD